MSPKQQKVCRYYLEGMSMRLALIKAGFSDAYASHNAAKFLHSREVMEYIRKRQKELEDAELADMKFVRRKLMEIAEKRGIEERDAIAATRALGDMIIEMEKLQAKIKEIEVAKESPKEFVINLNEIKKDA